MTDPVRRLLAAAGPDEFSVSRTLPGFAFHDDDLFQAETKNLFSQWMCAGHVNAVAAPGQRRVIEYGRHSVIVMRDDAGQLRAFHNVCRHRGTRLLEAGDGHCRHIVCPSHAWRYGIDGQLLNAPGMEQATHFLPNELGLRAVRVEVLLGFVFVCLDDQAPSLADIYADFPDLGAIDLAPLQRGALHDYDVGCNWKLICENFNECYHCAGAHPQLHRLSRDADLPEFNHRGTHFTGGPMRIEPPNLSMTGDGTTGRPLLPGIDPEAPRLTYYFNLFPNLLLSIAPDYAMAHYLFPRSATQTYVQTEWLFPATVRNEVNFDPSDAVDFWEQTNQQDWALCVNAQAGLASDAHVPGPYHPLERCVHDFDRWYLRSLGA